MVLKVFNDGNVRVLARHYEFNIEDQFDAREYAYEQKVKEYKAKATNVDAFEMPKMTVDFGQVESYPMQAPVAFMVSFSSAIFIDFNILSSFALSFKIFNKVFL